MKMYCLTENDLLDKVSEGLKKSLSKEDVFSNKIKISHLKRIDKIFDKGLHYYLDPKAPETSKETSIFFRKQSFAADDLNSRSVKVVNQFEELKISLEAIANLSDIEYTRAFKKYSIDDNPRLVATEVRQKLYPKFVNKRRDFLKSLISVFAEFNILVFEFVEHPQRKEKANIDGFFLKPNFIVLKRHQSFRREIFTLAHELGHYLLNEEEIEKLDLEILANKNLPRTERWCNDFAFHFLAGDYSKVLDSVEKASAHNDYHFDLIQTISKNTHLSELALFTRLLFQNQISTYHYNEIREDFEEKFRQNQQEKERLKQLQKEKGIKQRGAIAKPIKSPLFISTIQTAFYEGILNEYEVSKRLKIKPENLEKYIQ